MDSTKIHEDALVDGVRISGPGTYRNRPALKKLKFVWNKSQRCWRKDSMMLKSLLFKSLDSQGIEYRTAGDVVESHLRSRIVFLDFDYDEDEAAEPRKNEGKRKRDDDSETHWRNMCKKNGFDWVLMTMIWSWTWTRDYDPNGLALFEGDIQTPAKPAIWIEDPEKRGFIMLRDATGDIPKSDFDIEVYYALVDREHRRKGVLRAMFTEALEKYPKKKFWLTCTLHSGWIWGKLGFKEERVVGLPSSATEMVYDARS